MILIYFMPVPRQGKKSRALVTLTGNFYASIVQTYNDSNWTFFWDLGKVILLSLPICKIGW